MHAAKKKRFNLPIRLIYYISAVEDRNGRVISGDTKKPRELLEYIVLERHLENEHGKWKICGKLYPK